MKIINIDVKDKIIINNIEDIDTGDLTGVSSKVIIPTGNYNNIILNFNFHNDKLCEDLKMFANFNILSGDSIDVALEKISAKNREFKYACYIPSEVLLAECKFTLGLYGFALNEDETLKQRVSFMPIENSVVQGTYDPDSHEGAVPTPSVFEVYFQQVQDINEQIENEYQGIIDRLEEIKEEHINDFNEKIEPEKQKATEEVMADIDKHFEENASSYRKDIDSNTTRIKRLESNIFDSGETSGTSINIKDSTLAEFQEIEIEGVCKQVSTSTENGDEYNSPSPDYPQDIEVVDAYNLFDNDNANILNLALDAGNGTILNNDNGRIFYMEIPTGTDNLTVSRIAGQRFAIGTTDSIPNIGSTCLNYVSNHTYTSLTIPVLSNSKYLVVFYYLASADTLTEQEILDSIQIVRGTEVKPYVPYGCIRNKIIGKNHIDTSKFVSKTGNGMTGSINDDKSIKFVGTTTELSNFWINELRKPLKAGTYKFVTNIDLTDKGTYVLYDNTSGSNMAINSCRKTGTFKLSKDMVLTTVLIQINSDVTLNDDFYIMLVEDSVSEEHEAYQENTLDVNLQGNFMAKIGDVADVLRVENSRAILTKRIGKVVLNGSEEWSYDQTYAIFSSNVLIGAKDDKETINTMSNCFISVSYNNRGGDFARIYANNSWAAIRGVEQTTVDEFKTWLQANPATVYYILAEPYEVELGEVDMPFSYYPETNIFVSHELSPNIKVKYYRNFEKTIQNLQVNEKALKQELIDINSRLSDCEENSTGGGVTPEYIDKILGDINSVLSTLTEVSE